MLFWLPPKLCENESNTVLYETPHICFLSYVDYKLQYVNIKRPHIDWLVLVALFLYWLPFARHWSTDQIFLVPLIADIIKIVDSRRCSCPHISSRTTSFLQLRRVLCQCYTYWATIWKPTTIPQLNRLLKCAQKPRLWWWIEVFANVRMAL